MEYRVITVKADVDQDRRPGDASYPLARDRRQAVLGRVEAAVHEYGLVQVDGELPAPVIETELSPAGEGDLGEELPGGHPSRF